MSRETLLPLAIVVGVALALGAAYEWLDAREHAEAESAHEARVREREASEAHAIDEQRAESLELLRSSLPGIVLGLDLEAVIAARPTGAVTASSTHVDAGFALYQEHLEGGAQVAYAFDASTHLLARVQILSQLPSVDAIAPHLAAMNDQLGAPTGIWDCHDGGGIATRRFTWRRSHVGLADILLVYGDRISLTIYVTTNEQMTSSLERAGCTPTPRDRIDQFPTSSPAEVQRAVREEEETNP